MAQLVSGTVINDVYVLHEQLGEGFFSVVFRSTRVRGAPDDPSYAIKFYLPQRERSDFLERFRREMHVLWNLQHLHVVGCVDSGLYLGRPFIVLAYLDGGSLREWKEPGVPYGIEEASWIIYQALSGLRASRMVHRDLKPDNLLIQIGSGDNGRVFIPGDPTHGACIKVADWGLMRDVHGDKDLPRLTRTEEVVGTPWYMSPEQCYGAKFVGHAGDLYALGCVYFELLVGEPPFRGEVAADVLHKHAHQPVAIPSGIPISVSIILETALRKNPRDRYASVGLFQKALLAPMGLPDDWCYSKDPEHDVFTDAHLLAIEPVDI